MASTKAVSASLAKNGRVGVTSAIATGSFVCYIVSRLLDEGASTAFSVLGLGACGWAWLAARALFDPSRRDAFWAPIVASIVALSAAAHALAPAPGLIWRVAGNAYAIAGSAALLLTFVEPFQRYSRNLPAGEKRFRLLFVTVYALLMAVSVLGLRAVGDGPAEAARDNLVKACCAAFGLAALVAAVWFRLQHPLASLAPKPGRRSPTAQDLRLSQRMARVLTEEVLHCEPDLKIGDVAARLGEPEHRVSQAIGALGFANFNRWINHHRVATAKRMLADPQERRSILQIAFACGFGSLGPFNRAFRDEVATTPRNYRARMRAAAINAAAPAFKPDVDEPPPRLAKIKGNG